MNDEKMQKIARFMDEQKTFFNPVLWSPEEEDTILYTRDDGNVFAEIIVHVSDDRESYTATEITPIDFAPLRVTRNTKSVISLLVEQLLRGSIINIKLFRTGEKTLEYNASYDYIKDII